MQKLIKIKPTKLGNIKEKLYNTASVLYDKMFENLYNECNELPNVKKDKPNEKFNPINLKLKNYDYDGWFTEEEKELNDKEELDDLQPLEGDEEEV